MQHGEKGPFLPPSAAVSLYSSHATVTLDELVKERLLWQNGNGLSIRQRSRKVAYLVGHFRLPFVNGADRVHNDFLTT